MLSNLPLFPAQASTMAVRVDHLLYYLLGVSVFFSTVIAVALVYFAVKYRRRTELDRPPRIRNPLMLEITWIAIPFALTMVMFFWGASLFVHLKRPPDDATEIFVVGKQWMWKLQHLEGAREIDELHVPVHRPIKLTMTSEDVIHSFFVPAFRIKQDVLPGRYTTTWFEATTVGTYHLFCTQYCGTDHSRMIGQVIVMEQRDYQNWLGGGAGGSLAAAGEKLFQQLGCITCHRPGAGGRGPMLVGLYDTTVQLQDGSRVRADDAYIRESILNPQAKIVMGFQPIMPTFKGLVSEEGVLQLIAYIRSLGKPEGTGMPPIGQGRILPTPAAMQQ